MFNVADIARVASKTPVSSLALHGLVLGYISDPIECSGLELIKGNWALLQLYGVSCLAEDYFGTSRHYLTSDSTVIVCLDDDSLVGKLVTVYGNSKTGGATVKRQNGYGKLNGFVSLNFKKVADKWSVLPSVAEVFRFNLPKDFRDLFNQMSTYGSPYLDITKSVLSFTGSKSEVILTEDKSISDYRLPRDSAFSLYEKARLANSTFIESLPTYKRVDYSDLKLIVDKYNSLPDKYGNTIIDKTTKRFSQLYRVDDYKGLLQELTGLDYGSCDSLILASSPYSLYLKGLLGYELAELAFQVSSLLGTLGNLEDENVLRSVSRVDYLVSNIGGLCSSSDIEGTYSSLPSLSRFASSVLSAMGSVAGVGAILGCQDALRRAVLGGLVVSPTPLLYVSYRGLSRVLGVLAFLGSYRSVETDYSWELFKDNISRIENSSNVVFNKSMRLSLLEVNTRLGFISCYDYSLRSALIELYASSLYSSGQFTGVSLVTIGYNTFSWVDSYSFVDVIPLSSLLSGRVSIRQGSLVLFDGASFLTEDMFSSLVDVLANASSIYFFGNESGTAFYNGLTSIYVPKVVNVDEFGKNREEFLNSSVLVSGGKLSILGKSPLEYTFACKDLLSRARGAGFSSDDILIVGNHLRQDLLGYESTLIKIPKGTSYYLDGKYKGKTLFEYYGKLVSTDKSVSIVSLGSSDYTVKVPSDGLEVTSIVSGLYAYSENPKVLITSYSDIGELKNLVGSSDYLYFLGEGVSSTLSSELSLIERLV